MGRDQRLNLNIAAALEGKAPVVRDHYGRVLEVGDEVVYDDVAFRVVAIDPVLDPAAPPNLMKARFVAVQELTVPREQWLQGVLRVRTAAEVSGKQPEDHLTPPADPAPDDDGGEPRP